MEERRVCKKCLTRDMDGQEKTFQNMRDYIDNLDEDIKADSSLYEGRLAICISCDNLFQGMCKSCGCYVEMRAAVIKNKCPWNKW